MLVNDPEREKVREKVAPLGLMLVALLLGETGEGKNEYAEDLG